MKKKLLHKNQPPGMMLQNGLQVLQPDLATTPWTLTLTTRLNKQLGFTIEYNCK